MSAVTRFPMRRPIPAIRQAGISLIVVMVMLLISALSVLGATRFGLLGESVVGNEADYLRARTAADAMLADAMIDVLGYLPGPGQPLCLADELAGGCRDSRTAGNPFIPKTSSEVDAMEDLLLLQGGFNPNFPCLRRVTPPAPPLTVPPTPPTPGIPGGLCIPTLIPIGGVGAPADWWNTPALLNAMLPLGTTYGGATGSRPDPNDPILAAPLGGPQAFYWLEVFKYMPAVVPGNLPAGLSMPPLQAKPDTAVVRITVFVQGLRPGTRVVLQSLVVHPMNRLNAPAL
jgi:type IV pilus assembly protein PilX